MRIAQVAPLFLRVPPVKYGAVERDIYYLTEELLREGHEVTLFASGNSVTNARLISPIAENLTWQEPSFDTINLAYTLLMELIFKHSGEFDLIHFHDRIHFPLSRRHEVAHVTTLHCPLEDPKHLLFHKEFPEMPLISISDAQRKPTPWLNWKATIYNGIPKDQYPFHEHEGKYLAFLGRLCPEKGPDKAIQIAKQAGMKLKIAGIEINREYFAKQIQPYLKDPDIEYIGEIGESGKKELLGNAYALLFPIAWNEPLGLVMIEAMAFGTPVIAFRRGPVEEVITDGLNGFVVEDIAGAVKALGKVPNLSRKWSRQVFEERFTVTTMCREHLEVYERLRVGRPS